MKSRMAISVVALMVAGGCGARDATGPLARDAAAASRTASSLAPTAAANDASVQSGDDDDRGSSGRRGALHITKNCRDYTALAGSFCLITSSNLRQIGVGSRVVYAKAAAAGSLDSDIAVYASGRGHNVAFGHVVLDFAAGRGLVTLSRGTGTLRGISARAVVTHISGKDWAWDGTYHFGNRGGEE